MRLYDIAYIENSVRVKTMHFNMNIFFLKILFYHKICKKKIHIKIFIFPYAYANMFEIYARARHI